MNPTLAPSFTFAPSASKPKTDDDAIDINNVLSDPKRTILTTLAVVGALVLLLSTLYVLNKKPDNYEDSDDEYSVAGDSFRSRGRSNSGTAGAQRSSKKFRMM